MKRNLIIIITGIMLMVTLIINAQDNKLKPYNPQANAKEDLKKAIAKADSTGKNVLLQIGGNWCKWCLRFTKFCADTMAIDTLIKNNYVLYHLNYSTENRNLDIMKTLDFPQRFGFPVLVVLNRKGVRIHTQDSGLLEEKDSYNKDKIIEFLSNWTPRALNPKNFENK
ncbi:MAG: thioredoxin family protein [Bacteroidales bacterium]|jgi:thioredoxin-related protein